MISLLTNLNFYNSPDWGGHCCAHVCKQQMRVSEQEGGKLW